MSGIQRWSAGIGCHYKDVDGDWVEYTDHLAAVEALRAEAACDVCAGQGQALSGPCICGGTGKAHSAVSALRAEVEELKKERASEQFDQNIAILELVTERDALRAALEAAQKEVGR